MLLGELLIQKKLLTKLQLDEALDEQKKSREFLGAILIAKQFIREKDLLDVLSEQFHIPRLDLDEKKIEWETAMRFTPSLVIDHRCLPLSQDEWGITVAIVNPLDVEAISLAQEQAKGLNIRPVLVLSRDMDRALKNYKERMSQRIQKLLGQ